MIPSEPEIVPLLVMPPAKVARVAEVPALLANAPTAMPVPFTRMLPLLLIPPANVSTTDPEGTKPLTTMPPTPPVMVPALLMPPVKELTSSIAIAVLRPDIVSPERLITPPEKAVTPEKKTPNRLAAIWPPALLTMPPLNDDVAATSTPIPFPEMLPLLVMPPVKAETDETSTAVAESERTPPFLMPPPKVGVSMTAIAAPLLPTIVLLLSTFMPPTMVPVSMMPPLCRVLLMTAIPPAPMVPTLVTPPLKVMLLITMAAVLPPNTVGKGPVKVKRAPRYALDRPVGGGQ
jgi:hypothetical protein